MVSDKDFDIMPVLSRTVSTSLAAGAGTLQTRQVLLSKAAEALGPEMKTRAMQNLATAASLGSCIEFFISPHLGRLSDMYGRRLFFLFYMSLPAVTRIICCTVKTPGSRICLLLGDYVCARCISVQPMLALAGTMISDSVRPIDQPRSRSLLAASLALGNVVGNYATGYLIASLGPEATYATCAMVPALCGMYAAVALPETNTAHTSNLSKEVSKTASKNAFRTVMCDKESGLLAILLASYEMMKWSSTNAMSMLFLKERLGWAPLQIGRFAAGHGLASFLGSMISARVLNTIGSKAQVSVAHVCSLVQWTLWANATNGTILGCALLPLGLAVQAEPVVMTQFATRVAQLGVGKGEAAAVAQSIGAIGKAIAPILYMRLLIRAITSKTSGRKGWRLPLGTPMLCMAMMAVLQECMHLVILRALRKRELTFGA